MSTIEGYTSAVRRFRDGLEKKIDLAIAKNGKWIIKTLQTRLENQGIDGDGKWLGTYSLRHTNARQNRGLTTSHITLKFDGGFYKGMKVLVNKGKVDIISSDWKSGLLTSDKWYGSAILELTEDEINYLFSDEIEPQLEAMVKVINDYQINI